MSLTVSAKVLIVCAETDRSRYAVVNLGRAAEANTVIPGVVVFFRFIVVLITVTKTSVASKLNIADFIFQVRYADTEIVQFISIFVS